jgi:hypothetical protein
VGSSDVAECGDCPDGFEGDGFDCVRSCVDAECPGGGTQECNEGGECVPKVCDGPVSEGYCGTGECFEGFCAEGVCLELCDELYGPYEGPIGGFFCATAGYCSLRMCDESSDCGFVSECVEVEPAGGRSVNDFVCISHDASPCSGSCDDGQVCYLGSGCL